MISHYNYKKHFILFLSPPEKKGSIRLYVFLCNLVSQSFGNNLFLLERRP